MKNKYYDSKKYIYCNKCKNSQKVGRFIHCKKGVGVFPSGARFERCDLYEKK